jgi:hypothetical protein
MADPLVISALMKKRAEIDGDLRQTAKRLADLRADRDKIDAAIRVFDPSRVPHQIKPHLRRPKPRLFRHGECSRAILGMLRTASEPMTVRQIADKLVDDYHLDVAQPGDREALTARVRGVLSRYAGKSLVRGQPGADVVWSVRER